MPFIWARLPSSPPRERRDEVLEICGRHGGRLCENQIFYDEQGDSARALIELPAEEAKQQALLDELRAHEWLGLVHADEKMAGTNPPQSRRR
jgi:hypothetical protein